MKLLRKMRSLAKSNYVDWIMLIRVKVRIRNNTGSSKSVKKKEIRIDNEIENMKWTKGVSIKVCLPVESLSEETLKLNVMDAPGQEDWNWVVVTCSEV